LTIAFNKSGDATGTKTIFTYWLSLPKGKKLGVNHQLQPVVRRLLQDGNLSDSEALVVQQLTITRDSGDVEALRIQRAAERSTIFSHHTCKALFETICRLVLIILQVNHYFLEERLN
jgi:hypothetical protein